LIIVCDIILLSKECYYQSDSSELFLSYVFLGSGASVLVRKPDMSTNKE